MLDDRMGGPKGKVGGGKGKEGGAKAKTGSEGGDANPIGQLIYCLRHKICQLTHFSLKIIRVNCSCKLKVFLQV